ncbi:MAG: hypothetical protein WDW38_007280 [Sanguina aurantia]
MSQHASSHCRWTAQPNWRAPPTASPTSCAAATAQAHSSHHGALVWDSQEAPSLPRGHRCARPDPAGPRHLNQPSVPVQSGSQQAQLPPIMPMELTGTRVWDPTAVHSSSCQPLQPAPLLRNVAPGPGSRPQWERQDGQDVMHPDPNYVPGSGAARPPHDFYISGGADPDPGVSQPAHLRDGVSGSSCVNGRGGSGPVSFRTAMSARRRQLRFTPLGTAGGSNADNGSSQSDQQDSRVRRGVSCCHAAAPQSQAAASLSPPPPPPAPSPQPSPLLSLLPPPSQQVCRHADGSVKAVTSRTGNSASALLIGMDELCKSWLPHVNGATKFPPTLFGPSQDALAVFVAVEAAAVEAGGSKYDHHRSSSFLPRHSTHITGSCRTSCDQSGVQHTTSSSNSRHPHSDPKLSLHHPSDAAARQSPNNLSCASILWRATPVRSPSRNSPVGADVHNTYSNVTAQLASRGCPSPPHVRHDSGLQRTRYSLGNPHQTLSVAHSSDLYASPTPCSPSGLHASHSGTGSESGTFLTSAMDGEYLQGASMDVSSGQGAAPLRVNSVGVEASGHSEGGKEGGGNHWYEGDSPNRPLQANASRKTLSTRLTLQPFTNQQALPPQHPPCTRKAKGESSPVRGEMAESATTALPALIAVRAPSPWTETFVGGSALPAMDSFDNGVVDSEDARPAARFIVHETQQGWSVSLPHLVSPPTILGRLLGHTVAGFARAASHQQLLLQQQQQQQGGLCGGSPASHLASSGRAGRRTGHAQERPPPQR